MMMRLRLTFSVMVIGVLLSACGSAPGDRALTGAGIGATAGVIGGAMLGIPAAGAALGASAGAVIGAATTPSQVDLGKPVWR
jgi:osmotically inducible lipoprotein OsmB